MSKFAPRPGLTLYTADNQPLTLDREIGKGGEGSVWAVAGPSSKFVAKFYHQGLSPEKAKKIEAMCRLKSDRLLRIAAWPTDILRPSSGSTPQGFLMPKVAGYQEAHLLYTPKSRRTHFPEAQFPFVVHAALNVARAFATVHEAGQVVGDVNHANLMVSKDAMVKLIDCDSFEITDGASCFPCLVGVPTYTPPELQGRSFAGVRRTVQHDAFGLAVLLFHMLFLGRHPFSGIFRQGKGDKTIEEAIRELRFAYGADSARAEMEQPTWVPKLAAFPADIGLLFSRAFGSEGASGRRPTAHEWVSAIVGLSRSLKPCPANSSHHYYQALSVCPWCTAEKACGIPIFGITVTVFRGTAFDVVAIWGRIEAVKPDTSKGPQFGNAYSDHCVPDPNVREIASERRKKRMLSAGIILLALAIVAPGTLPALLSIGVLIAALAGSSKLWRAGAKLAEPIIRSRENAVRSRDAAYKCWQALENCPPAFEEAQARLRGHRSELENLPSLKAARMNTLKANLRNKQLTRHLERHHIIDANIPGIGIGRKSLLMAHGIDDASDVQPGITIKGFGPTLMANLLGWRNWVERSFVFNPNEPPDPADVHAVEQQIEQRKNELVKALLNGPSVLQQILQSWQAERATAIANVDRWAKAAAQAEADYKGLGRV